eukprot:scaffold771_cov147-Skeletonema_menzelii.AAC.4
MNSCRWHDMIILPVLLYYFLAIIAIARGCGFGCMLHQHASDSLSSSMHCVALGESRFLENVGDDRQ